METRANNLLVGSFVLLVAAAMIGFLLWLGRSSTETDGVPYRIEFKGAVSGLSEGSQVRFRGVPVGRVRTIRIDQENPELILVDVDLKPDTPVRVDTIAAVAPQGITGYSLIELSGGKAASPMLTPPEDGSPPLIQSKPSPLEQVVQSAPELLAQASILLTRVNTLVSDENVTRLDKVVGDLQEFADALAQSRDGMNNLLGGAATALMNASQAGAKASNALEVVAKGGSEALTSIRDAAKSAGTAATRLDGVVKDVRQPLNDFSQTALYDFGQLVSEMRDLVGSLRQITTEVERDPAGFLLGGQRGFQPR